MRTARATLVIGLLTALVLLLMSVPANAGCGCDKPPPPPAAIRPTFASPGDTVTLFSDQLRVGDSYAVQFGNDGNNEVTGVAVSRRDLADGVYKPQLSVRVPSASPGPTRVRVKSKIKGSSDQILMIAASAFTVLQPAIKLDETDGETLAKCYGAAVGWDGTVYIPLDIGSIKQRMLFSGLGENYPLLFSGGDIAIYNTQGFLMQLLGPQQASIFAITDPGSPDSFELTYDRHEFLTYRDQHVHQGNLALDPTDPAWHVDGSRHIDHDHLVIAIRGELENGRSPDAGQTPSFDLSIITAVEDASAPSSTRVISWTSSCDH